MLKNYPEGSDLTVLNTVYHYPKKRDGQKYDKGSIDVIFRDNITGEKHVENIENPDYHFYVAKDEVQVPYNRYFIPKKDVELVITPYNEMSRTVAELTGNLEFYYENIRSGNRRENRKLNRHPRVFSSDMHIEDHYKARFDMLYTNSLYNNKKAYLDIEADVIDCKGDFPEPGECPINALTIIDETTNTVYTLILRDPNNPLIEEFEKSVGPELFDELRWFIRKQVHGWKNEIRFGLDKLNYQMFFYDDEITLIADLFRLINHNKPDFVLAWNMAFDIPYIIARIKELGYTPESIMCHPDFKIPIVDYFVDNVDLKTGGMKPFAERGDFAKISSYSIFLDQQIQFASRRKGQSAFQNFKLDYIGEVVTGVKKLDYHHITNNLAKLPYVDFKTFIFYNIIDTIVQKCVESKTGDIDYIFAKCLLNNTRYSKGHRQTAYLINRASKVFDEAGLVIGNNVNGGNTKIGYPGALVADPSLVSDYAKMYIAGNPVLLFNNLDDFDYKSLYPSIDEEFNIAPNTQIGRIEIEDIVYAKENPFKREHYYRGGALLEDMHSKNYLEFGHRWLNLASYDELYDDIIEYFTTKELSRRNVNRYDVNGNRAVFRNLHGMNQNIFSKAVKRNIFSKVYTAVPDSIYDISKNINISEVVDNDPTRKR